MESNWVTYAEAAISLGIKPESVKRQARAKKWPRMLGNDGRALVKIPDLPPPGGLREGSSEDESPPKSAPNPPPHDDTRERLASAETEIRLLRERLDDLTKDRDALRDALARAASSHAEIVRPVGGFWSRLLNRD